MFSKCFTVFALSNFFLCAVFVLHSEDISAKAIDLELAPAIRAWNELSSYGSLREQPGEKYEFEEWNRLYSQYLGLVNSYCNSLSTLRPNDQVRFSDEKEFVLERFLGGGNVATVWQTQQGTALRIPRCGRLKFEQVLGYTRLFNEGRAVVARYTKNVVNVHSDSPSLEYLEVDLIHDPINETPIHFEQFLGEILNDPNLANYKGYTVSTLLEALRRLNKDLFSLANLGDGLQMLWNGVDWILVDFTYASQSDDTNDPNTTIWHSHRQHEWRGNRSLWKIPAVLVPLVKQTRHLRRQSCAPLLKPN